MIIENTIQSQKLNYHLLNRNDIDLLFRFNSSIENLRFVPRSPFVEIDEAKVLFERFSKSMEEQSAIWWGFHSKKGNHPVGYGGLFEIDWGNKRAEIGYGFLKEFWGKGYASTIVSDLTNFGFNELKLHRIYGLVDPENFASLRVLEKKGYKKEGVLQNYFYARGRYFDMCIMAIVDK